MSLPSPRRLDSWKEIAAYLRRDVRTVIRWEGEHGLPVYRVPGGKFSRVFAYSEELDAWLAQRAAAPTVPVGGTLDTGTMSGPSSRPAWRRIAHRGGVAILVLGGLGIARAWIGSGGPPRDLALSGRQLIAADESNRRLWSYQLAATTAETGSPQWKVLGDLDGDGRLDLLAHVQVANAVSEQKHGEILRFSDTGRLQWSNRVDDRLRFHDQEYGPPWVPADLDIYALNGQTRIAWAVHHYTWWPGLLVTFDPQGRRLGTFVNAGWIQQVTQSTDGRYLLLGGVTNSHESYFLAALDASHPVGHSPETPGSGAECLNCPAGDPVAYFVWPRTDVGRTQPFPNGGPTIQVRPDGSFQVQTLESGSAHAAAAVYEFSANLDVTGMRFSDAYWEWHHRLEAEGKIGHDVTECPERHGLKVQQWTPGLGWQSVRASAR